MDYPPHPLLFPSGAQRSSVGDDGGRATRRNVRQAEIGVKLVFVCNGLCITKAIRVIDGFARFSIVCASRMNHFSDQLKSKAPFTNKSNESSFLAC